jgi:hypothetical protein
VEFVHFFNPPGATFEEKVPLGDGRAARGGAGQRARRRRRDLRRARAPKIGLGKCDAEAWLTTMYVAHSLGMFTSATMMFGHIEGHADRVHHMKLVREWQDTVHCLNEPMLCRLIRDAGFLPAQRDNFYNLLRVHDGPQSPDLAVTDWSSLRAKPMHQQAPREQKQAASVKVSVTVGASPAN